MAIQVISFHCLLKDRLGRVISSTYNHSVLTHGPRANGTLKALGNALSELRKGEKRRVCLRAEEAYGFYNPKLVIVRKLDELTVCDPFKLGEKVVYDRGGERREYRVIAITSEIVTLDGNHPLAGQDLVFEIEATDAREATPEEIEQAETWTGASPMH